MNSVTVLVPLYNAEKCIERLNDGIGKQKDIDIRKIVYLLTESVDHTEKYLNENSLTYRKIRKEDFSHSLTREQAVFEADTDYCVLLSQDVILDDEYALSKLVSYASENKLAGCYGRQISTSFLDKYFRMYSYPEKSYVYGKKEYEELGRKSIFFSDVFSVVDTKIFRETGGYDHKNLNTNEDMYYANKCLKEGFKIGYASDAAVYHSHRLSLKNTYERYKQIGFFFESCPEIGGLSKKEEKPMRIVSLILKHFDLPALVVLPFNVMARISGGKAGRRKYRSGRK